MKELVFILWGITAPGQPHEELAVFWGQGAEAACVEALAATPAWFDDGWPGGNLYCAEARSPLAPSRSLIPKRRPERP